MKGLVLMIRPPLDRFGHLNAVPLKNEIRSVKKEARENAGALGRSAAWFSKKQKIQAGC